MSVLKKFAGQTLIYGLSTIIARLLNFVLTPLYVLKFPASVYGIFTYLYSFAAMLSAVLAFGMETTYFRYLQKHEGDKSKVYNNSFIIVLFTSAIFVGTVLLFSREISTWLNNGVYDADYSRYVKYFVFILVADALAVIPFARLRAQGRPGRFALVKLTNVIVMVASNLLFIVFIPSTISKYPHMASYVEGWYREEWVGYVFISNMIASGITLLLLLPEILKLRLRLEKKLLLDMLSYSLPVLIANISFIINEHVDKILIKRLLPGGVGELDAGIYGAVSKIAVFLSIFVQAFRLGAEPFFFSYAKNENARRVYALIMDYFVIAMVLVMVGLTVNIEWLKYFIMGGTPAEQTEYWSGLHIIPILLFNYVLLGIYMNLSIWYKLSDQTRFGLYISGIGAIVTIGLNYLLIPHFSYVASAWITTMAYGIMVLLSYLWGQRHYAIPYRVGKNMAYLLAGSVVCWLAFSLFDRNVFIGNGFFLLFLIGTLCFEWKTILSIYKK